MESSPAPIDPPSVEMDKESSGGDDGNKCIALGKCLTLCISMPFLIAVGTVSPFLSFTFIVVGALYIDDCTLEPLIPIWLIVQGVIMIIEVGVGGMAKAWLKYSSSSSSSSSAVLIFKIIWIVGTVLIVSWFVAGNVLVYKAHSVGANYDYPFLPNFCNKTLYRLAFWGVTIMDVFLGLSLIAFIIILFRISKNP